MLNRRTFLKTAIACSASCFFPSFALSAQNYSRIALWTGTPPGGGGPKGQMIVSPSGSVRNITVPMLDIYLPNGTPKAAMIVAGGGGYTQISIKREAVTAANWLIERGIAACVLYYRLPREGWNTGASAPFQDAARAIRMLNSGNIIPGLSPRHIGVFGFSAGGHLMAIASGSSQLTSYPSMDAIDKASAKPAFTVLAYPVITLEPPYDNTSTRKVLIGKNPTPQQRTLWSAQTYVGKDYPPTFLVHAANDPISNQQNTVIMETACNRAGVPVEGHIFPSGGHGFSMGQPNSPTANWPILLEHWMKKIRIL